MEGHLVCNGVFGRFRSFMSVHSSAFASSRQTWEKHEGSSPVPWHKGGRLTDGMGKTGREIKKRIWSMWGGAKWGAERRSAGGVGAGWGGGRRSGSDLCTWRVKLTVINPAEWSVRTVVLVFECLMIVSLCEAAGLRRKPGRRRAQSPPQLRWIWAVMGFVRVQRPSLEAELIGGSRPDNQLEEVGGQKETEWLIQDGTGMRGRERTWNTMEKKTSRIPQTNPIKDSENQGALALTLTSTSHSSFS